MATIHKDAVRKLLSKGNLSGFEVAKIVLADLWEEEHARDSVINENEQRAILDRLTNPNDVRTYNDWIGAFGTICEVKHTAHIMYLLTEGKLLNLETILRNYITAAFVELEKRLRPDIVTEKQFHDLKAKWRKYSLAQRHTLGRVLFMRADWLAAQNDESLENLFEETPGKAVATHRQACSDLRRRIESGGLRIGNRRRVLTLLGHIENSKSDEEVLAIIDSTLSPDLRQSAHELDPLLEKTTISGKALFESGLPEWLESIDQYPDDCFCGVAVLQNPSEDDLDSKGYYDANLSLLEKVFSHRALDDLWKAAGLTPQGFFTARLKEAKLELSLFLLCKSIMKVLSEMTGVDFPEDVDRWHHCLGTAVKSYEKVLDLAASISLSAKGSFSGMPRIVDLAELQPSSDLENLIRERLAKPLKKSQWFQNCKEYLIGERLSEIPGKELKEMLSALGKDARKRIYGILDAKSHSESGTPHAN